MVLEFLEKNALQIQRPKERKWFYTFDYDQFLEHFVLSLEQLYQLPAKLQEQILKAKFNELMHYLVSQHGADFLNAIVQDRNEGNAHFINIIENNRYNKLSLEELAFLTNMSVSTFKRTFFKEYEKTPIKWFNEERLKHCASLLKRGQKRPIDLYEEGGL